MDILKALDKIKESNIDSEEVLNLIEEAKTLDLEDDDNIKKLILKGARLANKDLDNEDVEQILALIRKKGISADLLDFI